MFEWCMVRVVRHIPLLPLKNDGWKMNLGAYRPIFRGVNC